MGLPLPVVDIQDIDTVNLGRLHAACQDHGFFYLQGHSVPGTLLASVFTEFKRFFQLPAAGKLAILHDKHAKGYQPFGQQTLDYAAQKCGDTKETWAAMDDCLSVPEDGTPFHSPNQWPDECKLPGFQPAVRELVTHMKQVRNRVNRLLAVVLGQAPDYFEPYFSQPLDMLRAFHYYSPEGSCPDKGVFGAGAHTDWGHITYLMTDGTPGLEIYHKGQWMQVPHVPGAFICNICDLLQLWSGDKFQSTRHRVVVAPGVHRYSFAYFTVPAWDAFIKPLCPQLPALQLQQQQQVPGQQQQQVPGQQQQQLLLPGQELDLLQLYQSDPQQQVQELQEPMHAQGQQASEQQQQQQRQQQDDQMVLAEHELLLHQSQQECRLSQVAVDALVTTRSSSSSSNGSREVVVGGQVMQIGADGIRVLDYIQAKYAAHFADAGKSQLNAVQQG